MQDAAGNESVIDSPSFTGDVQVSPLQLALRGLQAVMIDGSAVVSRRMSLSANEMAGLQVVAETGTGAPVGPAEIARHLDISTAAATGVVDRLVAHGHLERHPHPTDRRRIALRLTPHAEAEVAAALVPLLARIGAVEQRYSDAERAVIGRFLEEVAGVWRDFNEPGGASADREGIER
jgi:DNA-binding MarR family transcriptional regulator